MTEELEAVAAGRLWAVHRAARGVFLTAQTDLAGKRAIA